MDLECPVVGVHVLDDEPRSVRGGRGSNAGPVAGSLSGVLCRA